MADVEARLDKIEAKLDSIAETLKVVAVQHEQITNLQSQVSSLWEKYDAITGPKGILPSVCNFQASCPRGQIKFLWVIVIPMGISLLAMGWAMLK